MWIIISLQTIVVLYLYLCNYIPRKIVGTLIMVSFHLARRVKMVDLKVEVSFSTAETSPFIYLLPFPHHSMLGHRLATKDVTPTDQWTDQHWFGRMERGGGRNGANTADCSMTKINQYLCGIVDDLCCYYVCMVYLY